MTDLQKIPKKNVAYEYDKKNKSYVILMPHKGLNHKLAQKFFKKPKITRVKVEGMGNLVWESINGENSIEKIGNILKEAYGEESEPLYERLLVYLSNLEKNNFIKY